MDAFEKLDVWKRSSRLCVDLYKALTHCRDRGFREQITRSALSVPSNIAEGYERNSRPDYVRFLKFAKASCGELRTQLYIGSEIGLLPNRMARELIRESVEISRILQAMISRLSEPS
jgi:four helix bundle protein